MAVNVLITIRGPRSNSGGAPELSYRPLGPTTLPYSHNTVSSKDTRYKIKNVTTAINLQSDKKPFMELISYILKRTVASFATCQAVFRGYRRTKYQPVRIRVFEDDIA